MAFGRVFKTEKEANVFKKQQLEKGKRGIEVRKMSKKLHPRRKNLFHVGTVIDFLNFA